MNRFSSTTFVHTALSIILLLHTATGQKTALMVKVRKSEHPQPIKLHTDSFEDLVLGSDMLIDRSLLIKEILELPEKRLIISCPPKWSKSVNLNMLKTFLQIETDFNGNALLPINRSFVYQMFQYGQAFNDTQNESFERPFLISQHRDIIDRYLGQYPVVHIRFNLIDEINDIKAIDCVKSVVRDAYEQHKYLIRVLQEACNNTREIAKKEKFEDYLFYMKRILEETETEEESLFNSLEFLCKMLHRHHGKRVFILIDDYDLPYYKALHSKHFSDVNFIHYVLQGIEKVATPILAENHPHVERVIITATYRITDILIHKMKSVKDYTLVNNPWLEYFAISDHEQRQLCEHAGKTNEQCQNALEWYMGYKSNRNARLNLGHPFSTANFLSRNSTQLYSYQHLDFDYTYELFKTKILRETFEYMINGQCITIELFNNLRFRRNQIHHLKQVAVAGLNLKIDHNMIDLAFSYLCASGYLTFTKSKPARPTANVCIPNKETLADIHRKLKAFYSKTYGISHNYLKMAVHRLQDYLKYNDTKQASYMNTYVKYLFDNVKPYDPLFVRNVNATQYYEELLHAVLNYMSIMWQSFEDSESTVWKGYASTLYMIGVRKNNAVIIAVQYDQPAEHLLWLASQKEYRLKKYKHIESHKLVAFSINANRSVSMGAE